MRKAFIIITLVPLLYLCYVYPFRAVLSGGRLAKVVRRVWLLSLGAIIFLSLALPSAVWLYSPEAAREVSSSRVPEAPGVLAIALLGWLPPLFSGSVAALILYLRRKRGWWGE